MGPGPPKGRPPARAKAEHLPVNGSPHWPWPPRPGHSTPSGAQKRPYTESLVCSRFVLLDECPGNSESWFLARLLARGVRGVVSFADPVRAGQPPEVWSCPATSAPSTRPRTRSSPAATCSGSAEAGASESRSSSAFLLEGRIPNVPTPNRRRPEGRTAPTRGDPARRQGPRLTDLHYLPPEETCWLVLPHHPSSSPLLTSYDQLGSQVSGGAGSTHTRVPRSQREKISDPPLANYSNLYLVSKYRRRCSAHRPTEIAPERRSPSCRPTAPARYIHPPLPAPATSPPSAHPARAALRPSPRLPGGRR